jgi:hypothetical protein
MTLVFVLLLVVALLLMGVWLLSWSASSEVRSYQARAAVRDIERRTVHSMLAAERATRREDVIDGSVVEERRP